MEKTDAAWAAGFFDGEGTTSLALSTCGTKRTKPRLTIGQKDPECLKRFQMLLGGAVYGPIKTSTGNIYHLSIQNAKGVDTALTEMWPYLSGPKREQANQAGFQFGIIRSPKIGRPKKEVK